MARHVDVHGGTSARVHAHHRRARRVHGIHAPVPAMAFRGMVAVVTGGRENTGVSRVAMLLTRGREMTSCGMVKAR